MLVVGLTGGIGAGKSTVAEMLAARGAVVVDADRVARQVVEPGTPAHAALVARFGPGIVDDEGGIDRAALAAMVFGNPAALADLNAITHPAIGVEMVRQRDEHAGTDRVVVMDIPLLTEAHRQLLSLAAVVVVDVPPETALERLVDARGMDRADAEARMAAQVDRATRLSVADLVVDNSGDRAQLAVEVDRVWRAIEELAVTGVQPG
ncbi:MAG: dephospho-CoA kinase [Actinomycetota bacterium]|nr:dephospho-CoA kinase [Actinomycetota bacterium]